MTDGSQQIDSTGSGEASTGQPVDGQPQTVEEIEAIWKNRMSGKDRAHNAETESLKAQIEALRAAPQKAPEGDTPEAARVRELEAALTAERTARLAADLRGKYPLAAGVLGDTMANLPEEKLAAIEAGFDTGVGSPPIIDPNAAPRRGTGITPNPAGSTDMKNKSKDELLGELRRIAPAYQQAAKEGLL